MPGTYNWNGERRSFDTYANSSYGEIETEKQAGERVMGLCDQLVSVVQNLHAEDFLRVGGVIGLWLDIGQTIRSPIYRQAMTRVWALTFDDVLPAGGKATSNLIQKLRDLKLACGGVDGTRRAIAFKAAEDAIRVLVYRYRTTLTKPRRQEFDGKIQHVLTLTEFGLTQGL